MESDSSRQFESEKTRSFTGSKGTKTKFQKQTLAQDELDDTSSKYFLSYNLQVLTKMIINQKK